MTNNHPQDGTRQDCPAKGSDGFIYIFRVSLSYIGRRTKSPLSITIADTPVPAAVGQDGKTYFSPRIISEAGEISPALFQQVETAVLSGCVTIMVMHDTIDRKSPG